MTSSEEKALHTICVRVILGLHKCVKGGETQVSKETSPWEIPAHEKSPIVGLREYLVEMKGLEPSASGLQSPRSPS